MSWIDMGWEILFPLYCAETSSPLSAGLCGWSPLPRIPLGISMIEGSLLSNFSMRNPQQRAVDYISTSEDINRCITVLRPGMDRQVDSAMITIPLMPKGLNSWKAISTMVAFASRAAFFRVSRTNSRLVRVLDYTPSTRAASAFLMRASFTPSFNRGFRFFWWSGWIIFLFQDHFHFFLLKMKYIWEQIGSQIASIWLSTISCQLILIIIRLENYTICG